MKLRVTPPLKFHISTGAARHDLVSRCRNDETLFLDVMEFLVSQVVRGAQLKQVDQWLEEGGSVYTVKVRGGRGYLERRVDEPIAIAAEKVMDKPGNASQHLRTAWHSLYGRNPDPDEAFREAIKAIEAAAIPVVSPNDTTAILSKLAGEMEANPAKWRVELGPEEKGLDLVVRSMRLVWTEHYGRHGTPDDGRPVSVTPKAAEAAVHLSTTLVHWFTQGIVGRA